MKIYDVTLALEEGMPIYPGDPPFRRRVVSSLAKGASSELSVIETGTHVGTHVDAPAHMVRGGKRVDRLPLDALVGPALVVDMRRIKGHIDVPHLKRIGWRGAMRILFRTRNSGRWARARAFGRSFTALTGDAARFLVDKGIKLVGVDGLSVDGFKSGTHPAHIPLLKAGVVIVEGLNLEGVPAGKYQLFCGPLKIKDGDGAPARVFLVRE
ncbi:MAG: cyclase family protein [Pseudomonadota bacterium]